MADAATRQRQLAAKVARRKAVLAGKKAAEASASSLVGRVRVAARGPFIQCVMSSSLFEAGIGYVVVARGLPSGLVGCANFLVDTFCLGIKDVFYGEIGRTELQSRLEVLEMEGITPIEPAYARKLIRDAAAYAAALGLPAAKDTPTIEAIFGDIDAASCTETFTFGLDGKPYFVTGPNDTPARIQAIRKALDKVQGDSGAEAAVVEGPEA